MSHAKEHEKELYLRLFNCLKGAPDFLKTLNVNKKTGTAANADRKLGNWFLKELKKIPNLQINIRRRERIDTPSTAVSDQHYRVCIDPLDGGSHYYQRANTTGLSHAACVTVLKLSNKACRFSDIVAGGIVELRTGDMWEAIRSAVDDRNVENHFQVMVNKRPFKTLSQTKLDLKRMTIFAPMHSAKDRELILRAFGDNWGMIRTHGSVVSEIAYVASGQAAACISNGLSHYSQGAGFPHLKGGGGVIVNSNGNHIDKDLFDLSKKTPVIFAANMSIAEQILERINR